MMDIAQILRTLRDSIVLSRKRKDVLRQGVIHEIAKRRALRVEPALRLTIQRSFAPTPDLVQRGPQPDSRNMVWGFVYSLFQLKPMPLIAVFIAMALAGGTSAAAEKALPGDILYPVKVGINEEVRAAFAVSAEAKTDWESRRAERRLEEAAKLIEGKRLDSETAANVETRFEAHAAKVKERIEALREKNPELAVRLASKMEVSLKIHDEVLGALQAKFGTSTPVQLLRMKVKNRIEHAMKTRVEADAKAEAEAKAGGPSGKSAAEGKIGAAENVIASAKRFIEGKVATSTAVATTTARAKLAAAEVKLAEAKTELAAAHYHEAFVKAGEALRLAQEARVAGEVEVRGMHRIEMKMRSDANLSATSTGTDTGATTSFRAKLKLRLGL
ncbi:MAG: hypothetical protein HY471_00235 [Candidatus Sungbacteria bacterium]|nr:hypothetical protein [Candidatus Sungbacteria bacterium]